MYYLLNIMSILLLFFFRKGTSDGTYNMGFHTYSVPMSLFELNRKRLVQRLKDNNVSAKAIVLLEGGKSSDFQRYSSDVTHAPFRQVCVFSVFVVVIANLLLCAYLHFAVGWLHCEFWHFPFVDSFALASKVACHQ